MDNREDIVREKVMERINTLEDDEMYNMSIEDMNKLYKQYKNEELEKEAKMHSENGNENKEALLNDMFKKETKVETDSSSRKK